MSISPVDAAFERVLPVVRPVPRTALTRRAGYYCAVVRASEARALGRSDRADDIDAASELIRDHLGTADSYTVLDVLRVAGVPS